MLKNDSCKYDYTMQSHFCQEAGWKQVNWPQFSKCQRYFKPRNKAVCAMKRRCQNKVCLRADIFPDGHRALTFRWYRFITLSWVRLHQVCTVLPHCWCCAKYMLLRLKGAHITDVLYECSYIIYLFILQQFLHITDILHICSYYLSISSYCSTLLGVLCAVVLSVQG